VRFEVDRMALGHIFIRVIPFSPPAFSFISSLQVCERYNELLRHRINLLTALTQTTRRQMVGRLVCNELESTRGLI
jgi:hypothetical protein